MTGDCHAGICGSRGVQFPPATRLRVIPGRWGRGGVVFPLRVN